MGLVLEWLEGEGGIEGIYKKNLEKAAILYDFLDQSDKFHARADKKYRSLMNVTFFSPSEETDARFVAEGAEGGACGPEGAPRGGRYAREHLQRDAARGRRGRS